MKLTFEFSLRLGLMLYWECETCSVKLAVLNWEWNLKLNLMFNLKCYAHCPRPLLAPCGYQKLSFASPFWYPGRPFWHLGATLEDHGRSRKGTRGSRTRFSLTWGQFWDFVLTFFGHWGLKFQFLFGLVSRSLIAPTFSFEIWTPGALKKSSVWPKTHFHNFRRWFFKIKIRRRQPLPTRVLVFRKSTLF